MSHRLRVVIALILLSTLPLRAIAAGTMPCCAPMMATSADAMGGASIAAMADAMADGATMPAHHDESDGASRSSSHAAFDCCAIAIIAQVGQPVLPRFMPPRAVPLHVPSVAHFVTDAPDRPPRA